MKWRPILPWLKYLALKAAKTLSTPEVSLRDGAGQRKGSKGERRAREAGERVNGSTEIWEKEVRKKTKKGKEKWLLKYTY